MSTMFSKLMQAGVTLSALAVTFGSVIQLGIWDGI